MQKLMLLSSIEQDREGMFGLASTALDHIKWYINPEAYMIEKGQAEEVDTFDRKNFVYEEQVRAARETGELRSPKFVREAIHEFYQDEKAAVPIERTFVETRADGTIVTHDMGIPEEEEDLG